jgi:glycerol-3-phosphate dehydrogenase
VFRDYQFVTAERVVIDTLKDACRLGAVARNYTECRGATRAGDGWELDLRDPLEHNEAVTVRANVVINATGPWGDHTTAMLTGDKRQRMVGLKGIHIIVRLPEELRDWGVMAITRNGETLYCLPWNGMHYIGPTRTPYDENLDEVTATAEEVDWVLAEANHALPDLQLARKDVLFTWAGIQPVTSDKSDPKGTRAIRIHDLASTGAPNMLMLTGGPIITFRITGNDLADAVAQRLAPSREPRALSYKASGFSAMLEGFDATTVAGSIPDQLLREIAREEQVQNLEDLCLRRTKLGYEHDQGCDDIEKTAGAVAGVLGWDEQRTRSEVEKYRDTIRRIFLNFRND